MTELRSAPKGEFTGKHMLLLSIGFFGVILAVNVGMATLAMTSWTGLVVDNSYVASQQFEGKRADHEAQIAAGWDSTFTYSPGTATLVVLDGKGLPVDLGMVTLKINRPVGGHDDQMLTLQRLPDGTYGTDLELQHGVWEAMVTALDTPEGQFELHERFAVEGLRK